MTKRRFNSWKKAVDQFKNESDPVKKKAIYLRLRKIERSLEKSEQLKGQKFRLTNDKSITKKNSATLGEGEEESRKLLFNFFGGGEPTLRVKKNPRLGNLRVSRKRLEEMEVESDSTTKEVKEGEPEPLQETTATLRGRTISSEEEKEIRLIADRFFTSFPEKQEPSDRTALERFGFFSQKDPKRFNEIYESMFGKPYKEDSPIIDLFTKIDGSKPTMRPPTDSKLRRKVEFEEGGAQGAKSIPDPVPASESLIEPDPTPVPGNPNEGVSDTTTTTPRVDPTVQTTSSVPIVDIETPVEGSPPVATAATAATAAPSTFTDASVGKRTDKTDEKEIGKEDASRSKKTIDRLKEEIKAYHLVYDDNIPEFKKKAHTKDRDDALQSNDVEKVRKHHKSMETKIRQYFKTTNLRIGVIYDIGSLGGNLSSIVAPTAGTFTDASVGKRTNPIIPPTTAPSVPTITASGILRGIGGADKIRKTINRTDPFGRAIAGEVNPPRGGLHSHQQEPIRKLIPKPPVPKPKPSFVYPPQVVVDSPYRSTLNRPIIPARSMIRLKTGKKATLLC